MKYIISLLAFMVFHVALIGQNNAIDKYFNKYKDDERFTMVSISPKMFQMFSKVTEGTMEDDREIRELISNLKGLKILASEHNTDNLYEEAISMINTKEYEELMTIRSEGDHVRFMVKDSDGGNIVKELLLLVGGDDFVMLSFIGDIDLRTIGKLAKNIDIDGVEHLEKIGHDD